MMSVQGKHLACLLNLGCHWGFEPTSLAADHDVIDATVLMLVRHRSTSDRLIVTNLFLMTSALNQISNTDATFAAQ